MRHMRFAYGPGRFTFEPGEHRHFVQREISDEPGRFSCVPQMGCYQREERSARGRGVPEDELLRLP